MSVIRSAKKILKASAVLEGAGVKLDRVFGYNEVPLFDPFLLLDHFNSQNPSDYMAGFPWHPHRGIETVTYMLDGQVEHGDSIGNKGVIESGDVQWMTAGSGIIHQEMPKSETGINGFQLWVNLPAKDKMTMPRYQEIKSNEIPVVTLESGCSVKIICGQFSGVRGPVSNIAANPNYLDIQMPEDEVFELDIDESKNAFAYVYCGEGLFGENLELAEEKSAVLFGPGDRIKIKSQYSPLKFLLAYANPLNEPVAWRGPIVMNSDEELKKAFWEYKNDQFIK
ncbi:hypothetical protein SAMN02745945_00066 [Peptoclostridium litorale DSM 5388]|uniref:Pirin-like protein n=1 Tax=Peptoclostridium litorale DSM 5388 TaxID=1121324 RepID=A0A069RR86_PEPLI|nr:pirin family protein [Peptoclostridium litorale]KDR96682.1 pirin-like protein [Peptoclostridium litorale DSM 5388]SIN67774.1 hypothetical protein SAMN02745945_00066 [Peptoclostridium litorale DSM 5388]